MILGVKKIITSSPDIIKPMNAQRIQGTIQTPNEHRHPAVLRKQTTFNDPSFRPNQVAEKVAARISENFSDAAIVMVIIAFSRVLSIDYKRFGPFP